MKEKVNSYVIYLLIASLGAYFFTPQDVWAMNATAVSSPFTYYFAADGNLTEASSGSNSTSGYWWVNSGANMLINGGRGHTLQGTLPSTNAWRVLYARNNPTDTDNGYHPQNIFRLVGRSQWNNMRQEVYFKINAHNLSASPNRNQSNGLLLFNRYKDGDNLYYTGVRVDGNATIKKKRNGIYTTLAMVKIFPGTYDNSSSPNLLPKNTWIGLRSEVIDNADGSVSVKVYMDKNWNNRWTLVAEAVDESNVISGSGYGGIRTDFMDVTFDHYKIQAL